MMPPRHDARGDTITDKKTFKERVMAAKTLALFIGTNIRLDVDLKDPNPEDWPFVCIGEGYVNLALFHNIIPDPAPVEQAAMQGPLVMPAVAPPNLADMLSRRRR